MASKLKRLLSEIEKKYLIFNAPYKARECQEKLQGTFKIFFGIK